MHYNCQADIDKVKADNLFTWRVIMQDGSMLVSDPSVGSSLGVMETLKIVH